jgi:hypothetical protein
MVMPFNPQAIGEALQAAISRLHEGLAGANHAVLRGTVESAWAQAQGADILKGSGTPFNHIQSLEQGAAAVEGQIDEVEGLLNQIAGSDRDAFIRIRNDLKPFLDVAKDRADVLFQARTMCQTLLNNPETNERLENVAFGQGGLGAAAIRDEASLISSQLRQLAPVLTSRGIDPTLLPRTLGAAAEALENEVADMPINFRDATVQISAAASAARFAVSRTIAGLAGAAARAAALETISNCLVAIWSLGGRLVSVFPPVMSSTLRPGGGEML